MTKTIPAIDKASNVTIFDKTKFTVAKKLVLQTISIKDMKEGDEIFFKVTGNIRYTTTIDEKSKTGDIKRSADGEPEMLPLLEVTKLDTSEAGQMVLPAILHRAFEEEVKNSPIVGRMFAARKGRSLGTGKATLWELVEITEA